MSELGLKPEALHIKAVPSAEARAGEHDRWQTLVSEMGAEIATPLTAALERVNSLTSTGRIDKSSLRALRDEIEAARQIGMIGQQLARFASGRLRQIPERLPLADVLNGTLAHRARETQARGISVKPSLKPAAVIVDASLLFSLINTTIDWALASARSQIEFAVDTRGWPANAQLSCRFAHRMLDDLADGSDAVAPRGLDSLLWRMVEQTAWTMGLLVDRKDESHVTTLTLEFPRTAPPEVELAGGVEVDDGFAPSANSQPLAGSHVLIIASRREMRAQIRDALRNMSLIVDYVNSVEEAAAFCRDGLPHAVIVESIQTGVRFDHFREEILHEVPNFVFIEIIEEGTEFEMSGFGGTEMARVGREVLASSLPSALMFELSKTL
jgi:hypothetical protein